MKRYRPNLRIWSTAVCLLEEIDTAQIGDGRETGRGQETPAVGKLSSTDWSDSGLHGGKDLPGVFVISLQMTRTGVLMGI